MITLFSRRRRVLDAVQPSDDAFAAVIRHHSKSFSLASRLLPGQARRDAVVLYAWCRYVDDAVDEVPADEAGPALRRLEAELDAIYAGDDPVQPLLRAFSEVVHRRRIPREYPEQLLAGMRMDVEGYRYETGDDLMLYCYRAAGTVGLMMCHVMGIRGHEALRRAAHLGMAMQLTNICRDVVEDWGRGRVYLPKRWLESFGIDAAMSEPAGTFPMTARGGLSRLVMRVLDVASALYKSGDRGLVALPWRSALAVAVARRVYSAIGDVIGARGGDVTLGRAYVSGPMKMVAVLTEIGRAAFAMPGRVLTAVDKPAFFAPRRAISFQSAWPTTAGEQT